MKKSNQQNKWTLLNFDSQEEMWFDAWLKELGVTYEYKPEPFVLCEPVKLRQQNQRSIKEVHLLHGLSYQSDFLIRLPFPSLVGTFRFDVDICIDPLIESPKNALFMSNGVIIHVDTKGSNFMGSSRSSDVRFPVVQKAVYGKFNVYVNSVIPDKLFEKTFAPEIYFWTTGNKERTKKINNEFVGFGKIYKRIGDI